MVPTGLGMKAAAFYAVLIVAFFAAPYMNLFFLLLSFLSVIAILSVPWTWRNVNGVHGRLQATAALPAGERSEVVVELEGPSARARFALEAVLKLDGRPVRVVPPVTVRGALRCQGELPPMQRGRHAVTAAYIQSTYPFGFLRARRVLEAQTAILVHPAPADLGGGRTRTELLAALTGAAPAPEGDMGPSGLREWRQGDELRQVHWKASARRGTLAVREWEGSAGAGIEICLDLRVQGEELEHALSVVVALAFWAREHKDVLALRSQNHSGTYGEGHRPWSELLTHLAVLESLPTEGPPPAAMSPGVLRLPQALPAGSRS